MGAGCVLLRVLVGGVAAARRTAVAAAALRARWAHSSPPTDAWAVRGADGGGGECVSADKEAAVRAVSSAARAVPALSSPECGESTRRGVSGVTGDAGVPVAASVARRYWR